ncbi:MAG: YihY/virulence factor BrkB family protein [Flavobacteriales bacterium]|nr:YihY/virulence factor BrkB family protein [Flavobacteriales bacterium]
MMDAYVHDNTFEMGAALAYYTIFSIVPLLVVIISVSGLIAGPDAIRGQVFAELNGLVGPDTAKALEEVLGNAYKSGHGWLATVLGIITLVLGASGIFGALKSSLNRMWEIKPKPRNSIVGFLLSRLLSFSFVLGLGFLMVVSFAINAVIEGFSDNRARDSGNEHRALGRTFHGHLSVSGHGCVRLLVQVPARRARFLA